MKNKLSPIFKFLISVCVCLGWDGVQGMEGRCIIPSPMFIHNPNPFGESGGGGGGVVTSVVTSILLILPIIFNMFLKRGGRCPFEIKFSLRFL